MKRLKGWFSGMAGQLISLLVITLFISMLVSIHLLSGERRSALIGQARDNAIWRTASVIRLLESVPKDYQQPILDTISNSSSSFSIDRHATISKSEDSDIERSISRYLRKALDERRIVHARISTLNDKDWKHFSSRRDEDDDHLSKEERREKRRHNERLERDGKRNEFSHHASKIQRAREKLHSIQRNGGCLDASIQLKDGNWLNVQSSFIPPALPFQTVLLPLVVLGGLLIVVVSLFVMWVTKPLQVLAQRAEELGRGENSEPIPLRGPKELRFATNAFNQMQERLTRFINDRTKLLAAISHDLRTPITSLRIRAEFVEDAEDRAKMIATLDEMQSMVEATLRFARDESQSEALRKVSLSDLISSICYDYLEMGARVEENVDSGVVCALRPNAFKRALRNLIDNSLRYGSRAAVHLERVGSNAVIRVCDDGPGIPENRLCDVFEPFVRLEESRNEETGGIGLGLSICRSIVHAHGGTIELKNADDNDGDMTGLIVKITLPM
ncbi:ATP-binding protein [Polycladidibacter stylochi]|uniref:ATP-binding protein n=1 Tax=Polycladidibacter stylochi TaxID=1807766 RepID=UPI000833BEAD|nr:ATP-binding protein [Pseudovibrio stylochi]